MLGGDLLFTTREEAVDRHLFALAAMSASHDYTDAKVFQNWLSDVIGHLEALPGRVECLLDHGALGQHRHPGGRRLRDHRRLHVVRRCGELVVVAT